MSRLPRPAFCLVTPGQLRGEDDVSPVVRLAVRAAEAGVNLIQIRERQLADRALYNLTRRIVGEIGRSQTRVVVNERADLAQAAGADGVHLRADGAAAPRVRSILPAGFLVGRSVHSTSEAVAAESAGGVDYLIFGTVFATASKPADHPAVGVGSLHQVCESVQLPVIAIGGITAGRLAEVAAAGAAGFAAIGAFTEADRAGSDATREFVRHAQRAFGTRAG
jgi:thiamine-phosphate pyrophosphorylase